MINGSLQIFILYNEMLDSFGPLSYPMMMSILRWKMWGKLHDWNILNFRLEFLFNVVLKISDGTENSLLLVFLTANSCWSCNVIFLAEYLQWVWYSFHVTKVWAIISLCYNWNSFITFYTIFKLWNEAWLVSDCTLFSSICVGWIMWNILISLVW